MCFTLKKTISRQRNLLIVSCMMMQVRVCGLHAMESISAEAKLSTKIKRFFILNQRISYCRLRLLTHVRLVRQNVLILSEVSLYVERSKNLEKKYVKIYHRAKKFTFLRGFDRKNKVFGISRNLIDRFVFK